MTSVKIAELKDRLSATLRQVERGARVVVTDRDRPIAVLSPIEADDDVVITPAQRSFKAVRGKRYARPGTDVDVLALLAAERGDR